MINNEQVMEPSLFKKHLKEATTKEKAQEVIDLWKDKAVLEFLRRKFFVRCRQCGFRVRGKDHDKGYHHLNVKRK